MRCRPRRMYQEEQETLQLVDMKTSPRAVRVLHVEIRKCLASSFAARASLTRALCFESTSDNLRLVTYTYDHSCG